MKFAQSVRMGAWFLISLNLVMAFGSIWVFMRMAPAIEIIIQQNERSLHACEEMLSCLASVNPSESNADTLESQFSKALDRAKNNITEAGEPATIEAIESFYPRAFEGSAADKQQTITAILRLSGINREAMVDADWKARQFGNAGAWGIVFMASAVFLVGMLFMKGLKRHLVEPLDEIHSVVRAVKAGDRMRRCTGPDATRDVKAVYNRINELLDKHTAQLSRERGWPDLMNRDELPVSSK